MGLGIERNIMGGWEMRETWSLGIEGNIMGVGY